MQKVIKIGALLVVSTAIIYASYIMHENYAKKHKKTKEVQPLFSGGTMGNIGCVQPPCL
jgi:positive regulator of sigma E activity